MVKRDAKDELAYISKQSKNMNEVLERYKALVKASKEKKKQTKKE